MAPSYSEIGAMVYLAKSKPRREMHGTVASSGSHDAGARRDGVGFPLEVELIEGFPQGLKPETIFEGQFGTAESVPLQSRMNAMYSALPGTAHLKSFPSEKTKRGHYV